MTASTRILRLSLLTAGLTVAVPSFAAVSPLCDHEKGADKSESKEKTEKKKEKDEKKPANPA